MIFGGKMVKSSNHHALLEELSLNESGVLALPEEENLNLEAFSEEDEEEDDVVMRFKSEF